MKWSVNRAKVFTKCQRKWFFSEIVAQPRTKAGIRREAYILKQLKSIHAWRGSLVDTVIHKMVTPSLAQHKIPEQSTVLDYAQRLIESQLCFGRVSRFKELGITKSNSGDSYCAFYDVEYEGKLEEEKIAKAQEEINRSLSNLLSSKLIEDIAANNSYVISQRSLSYHFCDTNIVCVPDMIVFYDDRSPLIIDWKVHAFGNSDAWLQLGIYSVALTSVTPHKDFPLKFLRVGKDATKIDLLEVQLLKNTQRKYLLTSEDVLDIEDYIFNSINGIGSLLNGRDFDNLTPDLFQTAYSPQTCSSCHFKKMCWLEETKPKARIIQQTLFGGF